MSHKPRYFGVAGVTTPEEACAIDSVVLDIPEIVACGVLASAKTISGKPAGNPHRYPKREDLAEIFSSCGRTLGILHYNGPNDTTLAAQLAGAMHWAGPACDGIQLNITWPDPEVVHGLRISNPGRIIIFQLNAKAMEQVGNDFWQAARRIIFDYGSDVDYVLLDPSGGRGIRLELMMGLRFAEVFTQAIDNLEIPLQLGVAGGIGPDNTEVARTIIDLFPGISVDAEGQLRDDSDQLDMTKVYLYLHRLAG